MGVGANTFIGGQLCKHFIELDENIDLTFKKMFAWMLIYLDPKDLHCLLPATQNITENSNVKFWGKTGIFEYSFWLWKSYWDLGSPILSCNGIGRPVDLHCIQHQVLGSFWVGPSSSWSVQFSSHFPAFYAGPYARQSGRISSEPDGQEYRMKSCMIGLQTSGLLEDRYSPTG